MANTTGKKFGGRKKGTPNKETKKLRERIDSLLEETWDDILKDISGLTPKERIDVYTKLMEYSVPKLSRTDNTHTIQEKPDLSQLTDEELTVLMGAQEKLKNGKGSVN